MEEKGRVYFPVFFTARRVLEQLDDARRGQVFLALLDYAELRQEPSRLDPLGRVAFEALRTDVDTSGKNYDRRRDASRRNGKLGGRPREGKEPEDGDENASESASKNLKKPNRNLNNLKNPREGKGSEGKAREGIAAVAATRAHAREDAPDGAPPLPPSPEEFFVENGFGKPGGYLFGELERWRAAGCADDLLLRAMQEALDAGCPRWSYARAVLERCSRSGIADAAAFDEGKRNRPSGGGRNAPVTRAQISGSDLLAGAADRPRRLKRKE